MYIYFHVLGVLVVVFVHVKYEQESRNVRFFFFPCVMFHWNTCDRFSDRQYSSTQVLKYSSTQVSFTIKKGAQNLIWNANGKKKWEFKKDPFGTCESAYISQRRDRWRHVLQEPCTTCRGDQGSGLWGEGCTF